MLAERSTVWREFETARRNRMIHDKVRHYQNRGIAASKLVVTGHTNSSKSRFDATLGGLCGLVVTEILRPSWNIARKCSQARMNRRIQRFSKFATLLHM